ncbi:Uncharacterized protein HSBGL_4084 (plasmid) [Halapricum desulfuricans]|uniref:Uncharacterized protein n=1 Tax=Halapricum desulfuricans TaxID=2841257 RepID=A0A897NLC8_9EURY|nr:hypothetical protein [Halapricum desulfuricans]QSG13498.1 Uncharacterized protein HSBGL_4084 [Halapricum desulfuricans]
MTDRENRREKQADDENRRGDGVPDSFPECHRRGCTEEATFVVLERYQEETGHGAVEAEAVLCREHADEESPTNLDRSYADYVFRVEPLQETLDTDTA